MITLEEIDKEIATYNELAADSDCPEGIYEIPLDILDTLIKLRALFPNPPKG